MIIKQDNKFGLKVTIWVVLIYANDCFIPGSLILSISTYLDSEFRLKEIFFPNVKIIVSIICTINIIQAKAWVTLMKEADDGDGTLTYEVHDAFDDGDVGGDGDDAFDGDGDGDYDFSDQIFLIPFL